MTFLQRYDVYRLSANEVLPFTSVTRYPELLVRTKARLPPTFIQQRPQSIYYLSQFFLPGPKIWVWTKREVGHDLDHGLHHGPGHGHGLCR